MNENLIELVKKALDKVYQEQKYLIENRVHERSIVFWFGIYFYELLKNSEFKGYDLDFEYNRNFDDVKRTEHSVNGTYPDIILHKRGSNEYNLLAIEFKTWWSDKKQFKDDIRKLKDFINPNGKYRYKLALFVILGKDKPNIEYIDGNNEYKNP
ncbi:hypothetical protein [Persephonella sp.]|uniref:hypothetical protein n=1 Tax=Persephonella sp. TaxID=2060922 RepID=UPI002602FEBA|nr:hypothetical protein [Persephonella sp.]